MAANGSLMSLANDLKKYKPANDDSKIVTDIRIDTTAKDTSSNDTTENLFLRLPDEIMICNVLPLLDIMEACVCKAVCRRWRSWVHAYFSQLKELDLSPWNFLIEEDHLIAIIRHTRCLKYLRLSVCWKAVTECSLSSIASSCPNLEVFEAGKCGKMTDAGISKLITRCNNLLELDLSSCYNITDNAIVEIAQHCKHLKGLYLSSIYSVTDIGVKELAEHSKCLEDLDISYCIAITNDSVLDLMKLRESGSLTSLRINGCTKVSDEVALRLMQTGIEVNNMF